MMAVQTISLNTQIVQTQGNIVSDMGEEKVMLSIHKGKYYNLGETGGRIWELMKDPITVQKLISALLADFQVEKETCEQHVVTFLNQLMKEGLVEVVNGQTLG
ncbi:lasso peptide biosynthesis PqqD family chaperone [Siminovitchia acidinfaciens]|uniref:Lasso peptide biosynthesis PqqD family chaperone n=1 Tax=Siminovitchia acidinfaciens TaxID=2321395 RepID=A0A429XW21_9BACI|nr:lasso peptide biosynthesis PqqD family chaperone [Siminovitchia acidinfaciens]